MISPVHRLSVRGALLSGAGHLSRRGFSDFHPPHLLPLVGTVVCMVLAKRGHVSLLLHG